MDDFEIEEMGLFKTILVAVYKGDHKNAVNEQHETMWLIFLYDVSDYDSSLVSNSFQNELKNRKRTLYLAHLSKYDTLVSTENT